MSAIPLDPNSDIADLLNELSIRLGLDSRSGEQTVELRYENGRFKWARIHSGRLGIDHLKQTDLLDLGETAA